MPPSHLEDAAAEEIVAWATQAYGSRLTLSCSFGGAGGMVLLDMAWRADPRIDVFILDTGFLFDDAQKLVERIESRYGITVRRVRPANSPEEQAVVWGERLWERDPDSCCRLRKVEPMRRALIGYEAWMSAVRRDQSIARGRTPVVMRDERFGVAKISPLATWSKDRVWKYVGAHDVPINPLLVAGYTSIGCEQCTSRPPGAAEDERGGRWAGFSKTECGLHHGAGI